MWINQALTDAVNILQVVQSSPETADFIQKASLMISESFKQGGKLLLCGNGGSACDAMHIAEEFSGKYRDIRKALPALSFTDPGFITCVGNDFGFDKTFSRGVEAFGKQGDILWVLSSSGQSKNILEALKQAQLSKLKTISCLGKDGGQSKGLADLEYIIPGKTTDRIQEIHMLLAHCVIEGVERILFPENY